MVPYGSVLADSLAPYSSSSLSAAASILSNGPVVLAAAEAQGLPVIHTLKGGPPLTSLTISHNVTGKVLFYDTCIYDSGSTLNMCSSDWVSRHGLTVNPADAIVLHTSDGHSATTLGSVSSPIHFTFCKGHKYEHNFTMQLHVRPPAGCALHQRQCHMGGCAHF
jgi:hypothetical protein